MAMSELQTPPKESRGVRLLRDIRRVFEERQVAAIAPEKLVAALRELPESPWVGPGGVGGLSAQAVAGLLAPYKIQSQRNREGRYFDRRDFEDAWARYCEAPPPNAVTTVTSDTPLKSSENSVTEAEPVTGKVVTPPESVTENASESNAVTAMSSVTVSDDGARQIIQQEPGPGTA
jgi:hypothetical protein